MVYVGSWLSMVYVVVSQLVESGSNPRPFRREKLWQSDLKSAWSEHQLSALSSLHQSILETRVRTWLSEISCLHFIFTF
ncbi:uncharacterized protein LOC114078336 isoform X2 [Solanum pennellii]|uniref:Uncharacterized protein LOC114078336 isoform X2 n=1 Tax=Solanum pennellii TaxID=28526 RepID=A0ABM1VG96_SOLPN|nr:uncharacterized protein LOC114078336 isoform X2 [Solanum pennellii]